MSSIPPTMHTTGTAHRPLSLQTMPEVLKRKIGTYLGADTFTPALTEEIQATEEMRAASSDLAREAALEKWRKARSVINSIFSQRNAVDENNFPYINRAIAAKQTALTQHLRQLGVPMASQEELADGQKMLARGLALPVGANIRLLREALRIPGMNVNAPIGDSPSPLQLAINRGNRHAVTALLTVPGIRVDQVDLSALSQANDAPLPDDDPQLLTQTRPSRYAITSALLKVGANPNTAHESRLPPLLEG